MSSTRNIKCILIDPPIVAVNVSKREGVKELTEQTFRYPPIGLGYLAAVLRGKGVEVKIIDAKSPRISHQEIARTIEREAPELVGVTVFTAQLGSVLDMCKLIKEFCPSTKIVVGGPHIHPEHREVIKNDFIDFCVRGEGEITMLELVDAIWNGGELEKVKGITFKRGDEIIVTPERLFIKDLDTLPFPARDLLPDVYKGAMGSEVSEVVNYTLMTATRGCPFDCHFCSVPQFWRVHRRRSVKNVLDEMEHIYQAYNIKFIRFTDEVFLLNKKWVIELCRGIVKRGLDKITWSCDGRVDLVSEEVLEAMKEANCHFIAYGIEFGNQRILDFSGKKTTIAQIHKAIDMTKKAGISPHGLFMIGYPTETKETIQDTINLARTLNIDYADFAVVTPFPGTRLYQYCKENDLLRTDDWENYNYHHPEKGIIKLDGISNEELISLYDRASREFYFRHVIDRVREELSTFY